jgi:predicted amidohydrolase YtcJ
MIKHLIFAVTLLTSVTSCKRETLKADIIITNAVIYTVDSAFTIAEAMAIKDGKIIETGTNDYISKTYSAKVTENINGQAVFPGFIDSHCHFVGYGLGLQKIDLIGTKSFKEVIERVTAYTRVLDGDVASNSFDKNDWIIGRGWDQNDWNTKEFPDNNTLDSLYPTTPVFLTRVDGHAALANSEALKRAGITIKTKINGGDLLTKNGALTGMLIDNALDLVSVKIPKPSPELLKQALLAAQKNCFEVGITTVDDAGLLKKDIDVIDRLQKNKELKMRIYAMLSDDSVNYAHYLNAGIYKTDRLNVRSFKFYADGALGSRGACLLENYQDQKNWKGFLLNTPKHFEDCAKLLVKKGFQMNTHCIGDSAARLLLNIYAKAAQENNEAINSKIKSGNKRWRIEHAQIIHPSDLEKFKWAIPSVQPTHATSDMYWAKNRLGNDRVKTAYTYQDLLKASGIVALGTDFPVEDISPFKTFYAAVARKDSKYFPEKGFQIENGLTREQTLRGMTIWGAWSNFEELEKGSLEKNKFADFIILDNNIMKCPIDKVLKTKVIATYINGEKVYTK